MIYSIVGKHDNHYTMNVVKPIHTLNHKVKKFVMLFNFVHFWLIDFIICEGIQLCALLINRLLAMLLNFVHFRLIDFIVCDVIQFCALLINRFYYLRCY